MRRNRRGRKVKIQTWPLALAIVLAVAIYTHPIIGLVIALMVAGVITGIVLGAVSYAVQVWRGKAQMPARITRDKDADKGRSRWVVEFQ